jgi:2-C-methyl-D-erythritol 4-phosphate cytidylyltransferase
MNIALLTAAGIGSRMRLDMPKQFLHVNGKPVIVYTMEVFQQHPQVDEILVVTLEAWIETLKAYAEKYHITKLKWVIQGGDSGQESIKKGIWELKKHCKGSDVIIVHDGNRPLISNDIISDSLVTYKKYGSAVAAIPCVEAIFRSEDGRHSKELIPREQMFRTQTPHTYSLDKMIWGHKMAEECGIKNTVATCTLMQALGESVNFSMGAERNLKLTTQEDLEIFKALLKADNLEL